jgi:hypothetical protein
MGVLSAIQCRPWPQDFLVPIDEVDRDLAAVVATMLDTPRRWELSVAPELDPFHYVELLTDHQLNKVTATFFAMEFLVDCDELTGDQSEALVSLGWPRPVSPRLHVWKPVTFGRGAVDGAANLTSQSIRQLIATGSKGIVSLQLAPATQDSDGSSLCST